MQDIFNIGASNLCGYLQIFNIKLSSMFFWILWCFDALITLVIFYFFLIGIADGSVSSTNGGLWAALMLIPLAILGGSLWLRNHDHLVMAKVLLWILAVPGLIGVLYLLMIVISKPRFN